MSETHDLRCSLLVLSCDAYSDLWPPFFNLLRNKWPDCPYKIFLGAGEMRTPIDYVTSLRSMAGRDWSQCVLDYLRQIGTPYVLLMLDDFFLRDRVDSIAIEHCLEFAREKHARQVRLIPLPGPTSRIAGEYLIGECAPDLRYRISAQAAIWDREALCGLLNPGESAWAFEHNVCIREKNNSGHYAVRHAVLPYSGLLTHHVIEKGCWLPHEKWKFSRMEIGCDFTRRPTLSPRRTAVYLAARTVGRVIVLLPYRRAEQIRRFVRRIAEFLIPNATKRLGGV